jgi:hypothetical protein
MNGSLIVHPLSFRFSDGILYAFMVCPYLSNLLINLCPKICQRQSCISNWVIPSRSAIYTSWMQYIWALYIPSQGLNPVPLPTREGYMKPKLTFHILVNRCQIQTHRFCNTSTFCVLYFETNNKYYFRLCILSLFLSNFRQPQRESMMCH